MHIVCTTQETVLRKQIRISDIVMWYTSWRFDLFAHITSKSNTTWTKDPGLITPGTAGYLLKQAIWSVKNLTKINIIFFFFLLKIFSSLIKHKYLLFISSEEGLWEWVTNSRIWHTWMSHCSWGPSGPIISPVRSRLCCQFNLLFSCGRFLYHS